MRNFFARSMIAILLAPQVLSPTFVFSQQDASRKQQQTPAQTQSEEPSGEWKLGSPLTIFDQVTTDLPTKADLSSKQEPTIRVALATDVRSATISTSGHLLNATDLATTLVALDVSRVRLEPRLLSPLPPGTSADAYRIQIAGLPTRADAEQKSKDVREATGEDSQVSFDTETKTWGLLVGGRRSQIEAEGVRARLEDAGIDATIASLTSLASSESGGASKDASSTATDQPMPASEGTAATQSLPVVKTTSAAPSNTAASNVKPVARYSLPSREVVASAAGDSTARLFSSSAPVTFASDSEASPVRFNDRPYRGRIEVFTNTRGALTVVNVLGLEDYVKGVVPNELSAGGFPLLEAHKAQAIAARTYALRNRGQFMSQGYDLLPTTRSQVYRGLVSENSLSSRAVD